MDTHIQKKKKLWYCVARQQCLTCEKSAQKSDILCGILLDLHIGLVIHTPNILHQLIHQSQHQIVQWSNFSDHSGHTNGASVGLLWYLRLTDWLTDWGSVEFGGQTGLCRCWFWWFLMLRLIPVCAAHVGSGSYLAASKARHRFVLLPSGKWPAR